jgi:hypothetical protein
MRYVVILLVAAGGLTVAGVSQAATVDGVTVPDAVLTAGTGNQVIDMTISAGSPVVGSAYQLAPSTEGGYAVGITAAGAGGSCTAFTDASWSCVPGSSGWRAGSIQLTISTVKATPCCETLPLQLDIVGDGLPIDVDGSIFINAAAAPTSAPPAAPPTTAASKTEQSRPASAPATTSTAKQAGQQGSSAAASSHPAASPSPSKPTATATSALASPTSSAMASGATSSAPKLPAVVDAADARSSSSSPWILGGVAGAVVLLAGAFAGWRWRMSRQRN